MPISRLQFEMGIDDGIEALMVSVYDLLESNPDAAYSEEELYRRFTANAPGRGSRGAAPTPDAGLAVVIVVAED